MTKGIEYLLTGRCVPKPSLIKWDQNVYWLGSVYETTSFDKVESECLLTGSMLNKDRSIVFGTMVWVRLSNGSRQQASLARRSAGNYFFSSTVQYTFSSSCSTFTPSFPFSLYSTTAIYIIFIITITIVQAQTCYLCCTRDGGEKESTIKWFI